MWLEGSALVALLGFLGPHFVQVSVGSPHHKLARPIHCWCWFWRFLLFLLVFCSHLELSLGGHRHILDRKTTHFHLLEWPVCIWRISFYPWWLKYWEKGFLIVSLVKIPLEVEVIAFGPQSFVALGLMLCTSGLVWEISWRSSWTENSVVLEDFFDQWSVGLL